MISIKKISITFFSLTMQVSSSILLLLYLQYFYLQTKSVLFFGFVFLRHTIDSVNLTNLDKQTKLM